MHRAVGLAVSHFACRKSYCVLVISETAGSAIGRQSRSYTDAAMTASVGLLLLVSDATWRLFSVLHALPS